MSGADLANQLRHRPPSHRVSAGEGGGYCVGGGGVGEGEGGGFEAGGEGSVAAEEFPGELAEDQPHEGGGDGDEGWAVHGGADGLGYFGVGCGDGESDVDRA